VAFSRRRSTPLPRPHPPNGPASSGRSEIWDANTAKAAQPDRPRTGRSSWLQAPTADPRSASWDGSVIIWYVAEARRSRRCRGHRFRRFRLAFSGDGPASPRPARNRLLEFWDADDMVLLATPEGHTVPRLGRCLEPRWPARGLGQHGQNGSTLGCDGRRTLQTLANALPPRRRFSLRWPASLRRPGGTEVVRIWDFDTRTRRRSASSSTAIWSTALADSADGRRLASGANTRRSGSGTPYPPG